MPRIPCPIQPRLWRTERTDDQVLYTWIAGNATWGIFPLGSREQRGWAEDLCAILEIWLELSEDSVTFDGKRWWIESRDGPATAGEG